MPKYRNDTENPITPIGGATVVSGAEYSCLEYLKDPKGLTLVQHAQHGFAGLVLHDGSVPANDILVCYHDKIIFYNGTDAEVVITPNEDTANARRLSGGGSVLTIDNCARRAWHIVTVTGSGAGNLQIIGE